MLQETMPIVEKYKAKNMVFTVDGMQTVDDAVSSPRGSETFSGLRRAWSDGVKLVLRESQEWFRWERLSVRPDMLLLLAHV